MSFEAYINNIKIKTGKGLTTLKKYQKKKVLYIRDK